MMSHTSMGHQTCEKFVSCDFTRVRYKVHLTNDGQAPENTPLREINLQCRVSPRKILIEDNT